MDREEVFYWIVQAICVGLLVALFAAGVSGTL
jgi:hypothetical protein